MKKLLSSILLLSMAFAGWAQDGTMMKSDKPAPADGSMMKSDAMMDSTAYDVRGLGKQVVAYTTEAAAQALAKTQTVVYYFAATWCPTCQAKYKDLKMNFSLIPKDVTLVYVNYDKSSELKKKYGVTSQHTYVSIGMQGEKKRIWNGSPTVADFVANAKKM